MIGLEIRTSKRGKLWPASYYKMLIDTLTGGGALGNPKDKYPDLANVIEEHLVEKEGRYYLSFDTLRLPFDDVAVRLISVKRVEQGFESIQIGLVKIPVTHGWQQVPVEYFGTIGNSKYEAESKKNRILITSALTYSTAEWSGNVSLSFHLNNNRKDRDLDNLVDAIVPAINTTIDPINSIVAVKEYDFPDNNELLRISNEEMNIEFEDTR